MRLLPHSAEPNFQNPKIFLQFFQKKSRAPSKKGMEKFSVLNSAEIGGGSRNKKDQKNGKLPLSRPPDAGNTLLPCKFVIFKQ